MRAKAPDPGQVDIPLLQSATFVRDCAHDMRLKIRTFSEKKGGQVRLTSALRLAIQLM